ncbi:polysaccharide biosynthesis/export family protein [Methylocystis sp. 9N]|uniref:Polysaccharide biosynthesis/export family protein n=1 Tax=Methylocystis borbori TaxID=3118750 RepID=A0ABU7XGT4_9HYPH
MKIPFINWFPIGCALATGLLFSGCTLLPSAGPSGKAFLDTGVPSLVGAEPVIALVEVNDFSLGVLARRAPPTLRGFFGDYRPAVTQMIGIGDSIQITVWEAAAGGLFSASAGGAMSAGSRSAVIPDQVVGRDGSVTVPYAGRIHVAGRTQQDVEAVIVDRLRGKAIEPQALVNVSRNVSNSVTVTGEVSNGARVPLTLRGDRIMDVVASAGGYHSPVQETFVTLTRGGRTARAPIYALLNNPQEDIYLRPGDILTVERVPQSFTVMGATGTNAVEPFDARGIALDEAIGKSGGLADGRADPEGVFVLRYEPASLVREFPNIAPSLLAQSHVPVAYHLDMRDPKALFHARRFAIRDKDILYVSNSPIADIGKAVSLVQMLAQPAVQGIAVSRIAR